MHNDIIIKAIEAKKFSYSPYSKFKVGAALKTKSGNIFTGTNIECASYSATNCAERTAFFKAVSEGEREFTAIAIAGSYEDTPSDYCFPCGICRQVMAEFCVPQEFEIIIVKNENETERFTLNELLPYGFGKELR